MYKLFLTLDNEKGNKIERVHGVSNAITDWDYVIEDMVDSMEQVEKENQEKELKIEAQRQISNDKANS